MLRPLQESTSCLELHYRKTQIHALGISAVTLGSYQISYPAKEAASGAINLVAIDVCAWRSEKRKQIPMFSSSEVLDITR